jgi:hypothetical protein
LQKTVVWPENGHEWSHFSGAGEPGTAGVAQRCGVQIERIDTLVDAGASPDGAPDCALVNGHGAAAEHLPSSN